MVDTKKSNPSTITVAVVSDEQRITRLPCGCIYQDNGWILTRVNECPYHHRRRTTKRPYRPKAECVRP